MSTAFVVLHDLTNKDDVYGDKPPSHCMSRSRPPPSRPPSRRRVTPADGTPRLLRGEWHRSLEFEYNVEYGDTTTFLITLPTREAQASSRSTRRAFETQEAKANENVECNLKDRQQFVAQGGTIGDAGPDGGTSHSISTRPSLSSSRKGRAHLSQGVYRRLLAGADVGEARASGVLRN